MRDWQEPWQSCTSNQPTNQPTNQQRFHQQRVFTKTIKNNEKKNHKGESAEPMNGFENMLPFTLSLQPDSLFGVLHRGLEALVAISALTAYMKLFHCSHSHYSFPQSSVRRDPSGRISRRDGIYVLCLDCGRRLRYDWDRMKIVSNFRPKVVPKQKTLQCLDRCHIGERSVCVRSMPGTSISGVSKETSRSVRSFDTSESTQKQSVLS
jgi:hypothetical protein